MPIPTNDWYTVQSGDTHSKIAKEAGIADWKTIYNDPQNVDFRKLRPDPDKIYPGDKIWIAGNPKTSTGKKTVFVAPVERILVTEIYFESQVDVHYVLYCSLPNDPNAPSNTSVIPTLRTSDWTQSGSAVSDSVGNTIQIGAAIRLPQYIDSIKMSISANGVPVFDTIFRQFESGNVDTVWKRIYFTHSGVKTVTITPYSLKVSLNSSVAVVTIIDRPDQQNVKPELFVPATVVIQPASICSIRVRVIDQDIDQSHTVTMPYFPGGATLDGDSLFLWAVPAEFSGIDSVTFIATDDGTTPQLRVHILELRTIIWRFYGMRKTVTISVHGLYTMNRRTLERVSQCLIKMMVILLVAK